jgi:large subunit ribosomal protein L3
MNEKIGVLGRKLGMTNVFSDDGGRIAVTAIQIGATVLRKRTGDKDGYTAFQLGMDEKPVRLCNRPVNGQYVKAVPADKAGQVTLTPKRYVKELRVADAALLDGYEIGQEIPITVFTVGDFIDATGTSKGKGYQGVVKMHHMKASVNGHGTHEFFRHGGSIGCRLTPGRVHKGKRMSQHMGDVKVTVQNLVVERIDEEQKILLVRGAVPGGKNAYLVLRLSKKRIKSAPKVVAPTKALNPLKASKRGQAQS